MLIWVLPIIKIKKKNSIQMNKKMLIYINGTKFQNIYDSYNKIKNSWNWLFFKEKFRQKALIKQEISQMSYFENYFLK